MIASSGRHLHLKAGPAQLRPKSRTDEQEVLQSRSTSTLMDQLECAIGRYVSPVYSPLTSRPAFDFTEPNRAER